MSRVEALRSVCSEMKSAAAAVDSIDGLGGQPRSRPGRSDAPSWQDVHAPAAQAALRQGTAHVPHADDPERVRPARSTPRWPSGSLRFSIVRQRILMPLDHAAGAPISRQNAISASGVGQHARRLLPTAMRARRAGFLIDIVETDRKIADDLETRACSSTAASTLVGQQGNQPIDCSDSAPRTSAGGGRGRAISAASQASWIRFMPIIGEDARDETFSLPAIITGSLDYFKWSHRREGKERRGRRRIQGTVEKSEFNLLLQFFAPSAAGNYFSAMIETIACVMPLEERMRIDAGRAGAIMPSTGRC